MVRRKEEERKTRNDQNGSLLLFVVDRCVRESDTGADEANTTTCFALPRFVGDTLASWTLFVLLRRRQGRSILHSPFESSDSEGLSVFGQFEPSTNDTAFERLKTAVRHSPKIQQIEKNPKPSQEVFG
jgi:hypothetical protein